MTNTNKKLQQKNDSIFLYKCVNNSNTNQQNNNNSNINYNRRSSADCIGGVDRIFLFLMDVGALSACIFLPHTEQLQLRPAPPDLNRVNSHRRKQKPFLLDSLLYFYFSCASCVNIYSRWTFVFEENVCVWTSMDYLIINFGRLK